MHPITKLGAAAVMSLALAVPAVAQHAPRLALELRGGANVPTFGIADVAKTGPSFGGGLDLAVGSRYHLLAEGDFGFHDGVAGPNVNVFHFVGKAGVDLLNGETPWSLMLNAGAGVLRFAVDGGSSYVYPAINVGAKIGYRLSDRLSVVLSPQGDIAFSKTADVGTSNSWVWPFAAGLRLRF
jgi:hypothetical protein